MGANASIRGNNGSTKVQSEYQAIDALLLVISKNVSSMEQLVYQIDSCEDVEELKNQLNEKQNHISELIKDATADIGQLANLDSSKISSSQRKLQKERQRERLQNELKATVEEFQSVQKLAAGKEEIMMGKKKQELKNELQTVSALILIITKKVRLMKQIIHQLTTSPENTEELLSKLDATDFYIGLLINDASDCIEKQADSLIPAGSINSNKDLRQALKLEDGLSMVDDIDGLFSSIQRLDDERQTVMTKVNEFKKLLLRKKNEKQI